jgi:hypothetical protein
MFPHMCMEYKIFHKFFYKKYNISKKIFRTAELHVNESLSLITSGK